MDARPVGADGTGNHELRVPDRPRGRPAVEGRAARSAGPLRAAPRPGRARDAVHRPVHRAALRGRDRGPVRGRGERVAGRRHDPTHFHEGTHETFAVLEGSVRLFFEDTEGAQQSQLLTAGDFGYMPAGYPHAYRIEQAAR